MVASDIAFEPVLPRALNKQSDGADVAEILQTMNLNGDTEIGRGVVDNISTSASIIARKRSKMLDVATRLYKAATVSSANSAALTALRYQSPNRGRSPSPSSARRSFDAGALKKTPVPEKTRPVSAERRRSYYGMSVSENKSTKSDTVISLSRNSLVIARKLSARSLSSSTQSDTSISSSSIDLGTEPKGYISVDYRESGSIRKAWNSSTKSSEVKVNPARKKSPSRRSLRTVDQTLNSKTTTNGQATTVDIGKWRGTENGKSKLSRSMDFGLSKQGPLSKMSSSLARSPLSVDKSAANSRILSQSANESPTLKLVRRKLGKSADRQASRYENAFENSIHRAEGQGTVEENCSDTESSSSGSLSVASIVNLRPRATAVPAHFWQDSTTSMKQLRVLGPSRSLTPIRATRSGTSTPQYPSSPSCQSRPTQVLSPLRSSASPMRTRAGNPMLMPQLSLNGRRSNTPFLPNISFELYKNRQTTGQQDEAHDLRLLNNRWLQWRFINAQTEVAMEMQAVTAECSLHSCLLRTNDLRISVASKLIEINKIKQAKKLESLIAANAERLEQWETMRSAHLTALCGLINALQAAIMRVPLIGGPKIDIQATKAILFSAIDIMNGLDEVIRKFLQKAEMVDAFLSELANTILMEKTCLFESRDLLAAAAALEMEERSLRAYIIQQEKEKMVGK